MELKAEKVGFHYKDAPWLFRGVDFSIASGEIVGLTAPSGFGKTTLSRLLSGFETPLEGQITLDGVADSEGLPVQLIFQHPEKAVNPRWKMRKMLKEAGPIDQELLEALSIKQEWLDRWPNELSGGELQRFCIARALRAETRFLIADEMTTMLDAITQAQIWQAVLELAEKRHMGIVVVTHDPKLSQKLCHRIVSLEGFSS